MGQGLSQHAEKQFREEQHAKDTLSSVYLSAIQADPNTANVLFPKLAELWGPEFAKLTGGKPGGKGKGKGPLAQIAEPENLGSLLTGIHKALTVNQVEGRAPAPQAPTPGTPATPDRPAGFPHIRSHRRRPRNRKPSRPEGRDARRRKRRTPSSRVMQQMVARGQASNLEQAGQIAFGRRGPMTGVKVVPGSMSDNEVKKADPNAKALDGSPLQMTPGTSWQRVQIPTDDGSMEVRLVPAPAAKGMAQSARSHLTGEALQATNMNQMLDGIDPVGNLRRVRMRRNASKPLVKR